MSTTHKETSTDTSGDKPSDAPVEQPNQPTPVTPAEDPPKDAAESTSGSKSEELSELSLLEELFPEATELYTQPQDQPDRSSKSYPKLDLPSDKSRVDSTPKRRKEPRKSAKQRMIEAFQSRGEQITALELSQCSTELTDSDFRRLIPRGKHIESWNRDGEFYRVIPGRDPLSLVRQPFYYLLFRSSKAALEYQNNASRLHKLSAMNQPSSIFSAIPPPKGFLEDGEDVHAATSTYLLKPPNLLLNLNIVMQPYSPSLSALFERGGYEPIVPTTTTDGKPLYKVLFYIEGHEPQREDLYHIFHRHAYDHGISLPLHNGSQGIAKLRDLIDLRKSSPSPQLDGAESNSEFGVEQLYQSSEQSVSQVVMHKVYNRWILEFEEEIAAKRFALLWHRQVLPEPRGAYGTWRVFEEERMCNTEVLW
ncbi:hypothetical protein BDV96DRAFT_492154 [Lophiotrema nucula]|uniref:Uncharacterized protein n=1 Tax=Lophiotrema nucula TaxID=690887 RepID=A0A6A5Z825_9PLEO|nr:hypothetical protein BDV96DRAFT_492154 [Lophiotrema nucula]